MGEIGIVIVTYNSAAEIGACLNAALATGAEVVVVDNASTDGTVAEVKPAGHAVSRKFRQSGFCGGRKSGIYRIAVPVCLAIEPGCVS